MTHRAARHHTSLVAVARWVVSSIMARLVGSVPRPAQADWYFNNCYCADPSSELKYFEGDVKFLVDAGLDGVKIDGCGGERNIGLYQSLLNKTSTNFLIQDCHDSRASPVPPLLTTMVRLSCPHHFFLN